MPGANAYLAFICQGVERKLSEAVCRCCPPKTFDRYDGADEWRARS